MSGTSRESAGSGPRTVWLRALLGLWLAAGLGAALRADEALEAARAAAASKLAEAEAAAANVAAVERHPDYAEAIRRDPGILDILSRARQRLEQARRGLENAERRPSPTAFQDAGILATGAAREFAGFEQRAAGVFRQLEAERAPPPPPPRPPPAEADQPPDREIGPQQRRQLIAVADAFFGGDYEGTIALVSGSRWPSHRARAHAHLLRAAARYALFLLGGETDYALRAEAIEDILACHQADPSLVPDESVFSPRFREFFAATE